MKWKDFFPNKELKEPPYFDARAVCYTNLKTIRDYLAWRQVDCKLLQLQRVCPEVLQENHIIPTKVVQSMNLLVKHKKKRAIYVRVRIKQ